MSEVIRPSIDGVPGSTIPPEPQSIGPDSSWEHFKLFERVYKALFALPFFFKSDLVVSGVLATDLFTFNSSLGATIEAQVANALNTLRSTWDPDEEYTLYNFIRQPQTFPDVTLRTHAPEQKPTIIMGIELKGWFVLAKEREPSFRYKVTPDVCAPADLLVVYPWALSNVVSGSPQLFQPYAVYARYAAEYRNWWWQYRKGGKGNKQITFSSATDNYPVKSDRISDIAVSDSGNNFGRYARTHVMDSYIASIFREELSGIPLDAWQKFLSIFTEARPEDELISELDKLAKKYAGSKKRTSLSSETVLRIKEHVLEIASLLQS